MPLNNILKHFQTIVGFDMSKKTLAEADYAMWIQAQSTATPRNQSILFSSLEHPGCFEWDGAFRQECVSEEQCNYQNIIC
jgi:hypothetical protein